MSLSSISRRADQDNVDYWVWPTDGAEEVARWMTGLSRCKGEE